MLKPNSQKNKNSNYEATEKRNLKWQLQKIVRCLKAHSEQKIINLKYQSNHNSKGRRIKKSYQNYWPFLLESIERSESFQKLRFF